MKKLFPNRFCSIIIVFCCLHASSHAQKVSVASMKQNVVMLGTENPLTIMVENCDCNNVSVSTDNGSIQRYDECSYSYRPAKLGMAQIVVSCKGRKGPTNYLMRVIDGGGKSTASTAEPGMNDKPVAIIDKKTGGYIRKVVLQAQLGIIVASDNKDVRYLMDKFTMSVFRSDQVVFTKLNIGPKFNEDTKNFLSTLRSGDRVVLFNMECTAGKTSSIPMPPAEFIVVN